MTRFIDTALGFPTALFTFALLVVVGYWAVVLVGAVDVHGHDGADAHHDGIADVMDGIGLGGVPVTVVLTVLVGVGWFVSLAGAVLIDGLPLHLPLSVALLLAALCCAWLAARLVVLPLRRVWRAVPAPSRDDFVGRLCVVRTAQVGLDFGQAEVTAADGSSAVVQVRMSGPSPAGAGWTALIYRYETAGETFWITPVELP